MTVAQNISFGLEMLGKPKDHIEKTVRKMLVLVKMEELRNRRTDHRHQVGDPPAADGDGNVRAFGDRQAGCS